MFRKKIAVWLCCAMAAAGVLAGCASTAESGQAVQQESAPAEAEASEETEEEDAVAANVEVMNIKNGEDNIYAEMYLPLEEAEKYPAVIISHGFGGNTASNSFYAEQFAQEGFAALVFDFRGGGKRSQSDGETTEMSVLTEASDLEAVIAHVKELPYIDTDNLFLLGESQGGFVTSYVAASHNDDVQAVVLYYPAFVLQDDSRERNPDPEKMADTEEMMGMTIGRIYSVDAQSFDIFDVIGGYKKDVKIFHGDADKVAPISYSERAVTVYENAELEVIEGANHGWGSNDRYETMEKVGSETLAFFKAHLQ